MIIQLRLKMHNRIIHLRSRLHRTRRIRKLPQSKTTRTLIKSILARIPPPKHLGTPRPRSHTPRPRSTRVKIPPRRRRRPVKLGILLEHKSARNISPSSSSAPSSFCSVYMRLACFPRPDVDFAGQERVTHIISHAQLERGKGKAESQSNVLGRVDDTLKGPPHCAEEKQLA